MRVIFDILASTDRSGGMKLHSTELVSAWLEQFPLDDIHVVGGEWARRVFRSLGATVYTWPNENIVGRSCGQLFFVAALSALKRPDAVVSLSPIVSPLVNSSRSACFQHDWRHVRNPHEFRLLQRLYRQLWRVSARRAGITVCISRKAEIETQRYAPGARTVVIENGRDHARSWPEATESSLPRTDIVTFGHHNNKRPELVIDALSKLGPDLEHLTLTVLGARGAYADELRARSVDRGVEGRVFLPGFVADAEYQQRVRAAAAIVLASSDEGFGLPLAEAQYLGVPAVVTEDSGVADLFGGYPIVAEPSAGSIAEAISVAMSGGRRDGGVGESHTWAYTATELRSQLGTRLTRLTGAIDPKGTAPRNASKGGRASR